MRVFKPSVQWLVFIGLVLVLVITLLRLATTTKALLHLPKEKESDLWRESDSGATKYSKLDMNERNSSATLSLSRVQEEEENTTDTVTELAQGFRVHADWHPRLRSERFPSVKERVKIYMSNWYHPPCGNTSKLSKFMHLKPFSYDNDTITWPQLELLHPWDVDSSSRETYHTLITPDTKFLMNRYVIEDCARTDEEYLVEGKRPSESQIEHRRNMQGYCVDSIDLLVLMDQFDDQANNSSTPLLAFFGDGPALHGGDMFDVPLFAKHRATTTLNFLQQVTKDVPPTASIQCDSHPPPLITAYHHNVYQNRASPILWKLGSNRHWYPLKRAASSDIPWEKKKNLAIWRGAMTGVQMDKKMEEMCLSDPLCDIDIQRCQSNRRCSFVLKHMNSSFVDSGLVRNGQTNDFVNGTKLIKRFMDIKEMQQYKVIISMEGNDVSTALKWNLQSASVVLMPPPTRTSWAMEELLQPWVHYIPMLPDGSNAEAMVQWVLDNDKEAQRIAERATLFIYDLVHHPDAQEDERKVKEEIVRRYRALWH